MKLWFLCLLSLAVGVLGDDGHSVVNGIKKSENSVTENDLDSDSPLRPDMALSELNDLEDEENPDEESPLIPDSSDQDEAEANAEISDEKRCLFKCDGKCYNPVTVQCCVGVTLNTFWTCQKCLKWQRRCGERCIPKSPHVKCCHGRVIPSAWHCCTYMCSRKCYNAAKQQCCHGKVISRKKDCCLHSCGKYCFDPKTTNCCYGKVVDKAFKTCGRGCFNPKTHKCCNGRIAPKNWPNCGRTCYNPATHKCCHGRIVPKHWQPCGRTCYNPATHRCCLGRVTPKGKACCRHKCGGRCINLATRRCCHGRIVPKHWRPCGRTCYNPATKRCCYRRIVPKHWQPCGRTCYNPAAHRCCRGRVILVGRMRPIAITTGVIAVPVGCYRDTGRRAIPTLEGRSTLLKGNYHIRRNALAKCALAAARRGFHVFALQNGGWCASSRNALSTYRRYGPSCQCKPHGKGGPWANAVYRLQGKCAKKTTKGFCCVFPFIYKGKRYTSCTGVNHNRPWCAITPNYDVDKQWGNCAGHANVCARVRCKRPYSRCKAIKGKAVCVCPAAVCPNLYSPVCGSDGVTYSNLCLLKLHACRKNKIIRAFHRGYCKPCRTTTCVFPPYSVRTIVQGRPVCACEPMCSRIYKPVCGSDGRTYANECSMKFRSCLRRRKITVRYHGNCRANELCRYHKCHWPPNSVCKVIGGFPVCVCNNKCAPRIKLVCANDGRTYINECLMKLSACLRARPVYINSRGPCFPCSGAGVCRHPPYSYCQALPGGFSNCKCRTMCPKIYTPVCGSDNRSYPNECQLRAHACHHQRRITIKRIGKC